MAMRSGRPPLPPKGPLGRTLVEWRARWGLSAQEAAALGGVTVDTWRAWERGLRRPGGAAGRLLAILLHDAAWVWALASVEGLELGRGGRPDPLARWYADALRRELEPRRER